MPHPLLTPFLTHCFQEGLDYFDKGADMIGIVGEAKCGLSISIMALFAITFGFCSKRIFSLAFFAVGALGAGYGALIGFKLAVPLVPAEYAQYTTVSSSPSDQDTQWFAMPKCELVLATPKRSPSFALRHACVCGCRRIPTSTRSVVFSLLLAAPS